MSDDFDAIADRINDLQAHPFADMFPMLSEDELTELAESIVRDGLLEKIILFDGLILDGRNRHAALKIAGIPMGVEHFAFFAGTEKEAAAFVESKNINRRHLSQSQRALAAADFAKLRGLTAEAAGNLYGLGRETVKRAQQVRKAPKNIQSMVEDGSISVGVAAAAKNTMDVRQIAAFKSPEALKAALRKSGAMGNTFSTFTDRRLVQNLTVILDELNARESAELKGYQVELDTALQQLITLCERVSSAKIDEAQVA